MSNLPHPLGDSVAGDLFYPGSPSVTVSDAAGAAGSRCVEFGEDGLSAAVNRGLYALGKNDEYLQSRMEQEFARPEFVSFTPAGGNGGNLTFSDSVWCGDAAYTPEDQSMRNALISVLDSLYNELVDPVSGDRIVVKEILDVVAGSTQVGSGFVTNPYITFRKQNPVTGALGADYTIPDATLTHLAIGVSASLDALVGGGASGLQDAWFRGFNRSVGEIHSGTFLRDGSRKALGDFDLDGKNLTNVNNLTNVTGVALGVGSDDDLNLSAAADMLLTSVGNLSLKDQYLSAAIPLSEADNTEVVGIYSSLVGSVNSRTYEAQAFHGDCLLTRTGSVVFNGASGEVTIPELTYTYQGDTKKLASSVQNATATTMEYLVLDPSTGVISNQANPTSGIPLTKHYWDGATSFTTSLDLRRGFDGRTRLLEVTVSNRDGADFHDLQQALDAVVASTWDGVPVIKIIGTLSHSDQLEVRCPVKILGEVSALLSLDIDTNFHGISCNGHRVIIEDLEIKKDGSSQDSGYSAILNAGSNSVFRNVYLSGNTGDWYHGFMWDTGSTSNVLVDGCNATDIADTFFLGSTSDRASIYVTDSKIVNSVWSAKIGVRHPGARCLVSGCSISVTASGWSGVDLGPEGAAVNCNISGTGTATNQVAVVGYGTTAFDLLVSGCYFYNLRAGVSCHVNGASTGVRVKISDSTFSTLDYGLHFTDSGFGHAFGFDSFDDFESSVAVSNCMFDTISSTSVYNQQVEDLQLSNCKFTNQSATPVWLSLGGGVKMSNCSIDGYGSLAADSAIKADWALGDGFPHTSISGCKIYANGAHVDSTMVALQRPITMDGSLVSGAVKRGVWSAFVAVVDVGYVSTFSDNAFNLQTEYALYISGFVYNGSRVTGNRFADIPAAATAVAVSDSMGLVIANNEFSTTTGMAISLIATQANGCNDCQIVGNHFDNVRGETTGNAVVYVYNAALSACLHVLISDNSFVGCSTTNIASGTQQVIYVGASYCTISDNMIVQLYGSNVPTTNDDVCAGIHVVGTDFSVTNNKITKDFAVTGAVARRFYGIWCQGADGQVIGNSIGFHGVQTDADKTQFVTAIDAVSDEIVVHGNRTTNWGPSVTTDKAIVASGDNGSYVGNISKRYEQDYLGGGGVVTGCVSLITTTGINTGTNTVGHNVMVP